VSYRLGELSYQIVRRMLKSPFVALPNILAGRALVPELLQHQATPEALAARLAQELEHAADDEEYFGEFSRLHESLRLDADARAAQAVLAWIEQHRALD
jgi:lipid-A-disaccharide synthase